MSDDEGTESHFSDEESDEEIHLDEANGKDGFAFHPESTQVRVFPSENFSDSSPFHFNTIVDYNWESVYSHGRLIATHLSSMFIAYVVKVSNIGAVRVIDMDSKERVLMKGDKGLIKDVDFQHKREDIILGFIDEFGSFYINKIIKEIKTGKLTAVPLIKVAADSSSPLRSEHRRFLWCKYIPEELKEVASPKDCAYHFAVLQNDTIFVGNLVRLVQSQGEGSHQFNEVKDELLPIDTHSAAVTDASFAPDGTALATCSKDGTVKFFQIYFEEKAPVRCLFSWAPHDGRPIDRIFFLDNYTLNIDSSTDSKYWKYMVTAAENCSEIKLFTCRSWDCLQTLRIVTPRPSQWKLELSLTAKYLMATDIQRKGMYLLHISVREDKARFDWIREFSMPWKTIGFNISAASRLKFCDAVAKGIGPAIAGDHGAYGKDDLLNLVEINVVQPRSMQQGSVAVVAPKNFYKPKANGHRKISFNHSIDTREFVDGEIKNEEEESHQSKISPSSSEKNKSRRSSTSPQPKFQKEKEPTAAEMSEQLSSLIGLNNSSSRGSSSHKGSSKGRTSSPSPVNYVNVINYPPEANGKQTSNSSSPSREVEEILSPKTTQNFIGRPSGTLVSQPVVLSTTLEFDNGNIPPKLTDHMPEVLQKIDSLTDLVCAQAKEIRDLKSEVSRLAVMHVETSRGGGLDVGLITQALERHLKTSESQFSALQERLQAIDHSTRLNVTNNTSNLSELLASSISAVVKKELESLVPKTLAQVFEPSRLSVTTQIDRLTSVVEAKLSTNINQIMQRDKIWQSLASNFSSITKNVLDTAFNEVFMSSVFPRCQTAVQEMLNQVSETFRSGTREYLSGLETMLNREQRSTEFQNVVASQLSSMQDALSSALQVEVEAQMLRVLGGIQGGVVRQIEDSLSRELNRGFSDQQRYFETTRSVTPAVSVCESLGGFPPSDVRAVKRKVMEMAKNGDVRGAFTQASSIGDADILMQLCKGYNAAVLSDLNLSSSVLLSIMQLLASDILDETEIKVDYLNMSIMCLDMTDSKCVKGVTRLIPVYQAAVCKFEERNPNSNLLPRIKVLQMAFGKAPSQLKNTNSGSQLSASFSGFQQS